VIILNDGDPSFVWQNRRHVTLGSYVTTLGPRAFGHDRIAFDDLVEYIVRKIQVNSFLSKKDYSFTELRNSSPKIGKYRI